MKTINLRDYYPAFYTNNEFTEVSDEVAVELAGAGRGDHSYYERRRYHKAFYSLNAGDDIEKEAVNYAPSPETLFMENLTREQITAALASLSDKQRKRIYQHCVLGISKAEIARAEGLAENAVKDAIYRGLKNMEQYLKNIL